MFFSEVYQVNLSFLHQYTTTSFTPLLELIQIIFSNNYLIWYFAVIGNLLVDKNYVSFEFFFYV